MRSWRRSGRTTRQSGHTVILVSHSMEEIARNAGRIVVMRDRPRLLWTARPRQVFARAEELEQVGLDVPQVTKIAMALRRRGMDIDPAVYTIEELEQALLTPEREAARNAEGYHAGPVFSPAIPSSTGWIPGRS